MLRKSNVSFKFRFPFLLKACIRLIRIEEEKLKTFIKVEPFSHGDKFYEIKEVVTRRHINVTDHEKIYESRATNFSAINCFIKLRLNDVNLYRLSQVKSWLIKVLMKLSFISSKLRKFQQVSLIVAE